MSHIHLPDGVLQGIWWLLILGYGLTFGIMYIILKRLDRQSVNRKVPLVGIMSAIMLITMSVPLGFIPFHLNLAVLCGILVGPSLGFLSIFVVNLILAFVGHGGITVVGLNTLVIGSELFTGSILFKVLKKKIGAAFAAAFSTFIALCISTAIMLTVVGTSTGMGAGILFEHHHAHNDEKIEDRGVNAEKSEVNNDLSENTEHDEHGEHAHDNYKFLSLTGWTALIVVLLLGFLTESIITAFIVSFFLKVRPDLIDYN